MKTGLKNFFWFSRNPLGKYLYTWRNSADIAKFTERGTRKTGLAAYFQLEFKKGLTIGDQDVDLARLEMVIVILLHLDLSGGNLGRGGHDGGWLVAHDVPCVHEVVPAKMLIMINQILERLRLGLGVYLYLSRSWRIKC